MKVAVVVHPLTVRQPAELRRLLEQRCDERGHPVRSWQQTTPEDGGTGQARRAVEQGADLVVVVGGDGTVMAVADALAHSAAALGVLPTGTGNLLARNLNLPLDLSAALETALTGRRRLLDVGCAHTDDAAPHRFVVMAGIGFDAAMVTNASAALKKRLGWPAYVVSGLRHLRDDAVACTITIDGGAPRRCRVRAVLIGNVGQLQGGVRLLPAAEPDDGLLDVAVVAPRSLWDWLRIADRIMRGSATADRRLERGPARRVEIRTRRPQPCEFDGDPAGLTSWLAVDIEPRALTVMVPP